MCIWMNIYHRCEFSIYGDEYESQICKIFSNLKTELSRFLSQQMAQQSIWFYSEYKEREKELKLQLFWIWREKINVQNYSEYEEKKLMVKIILNMKREKINVQNDYLFIVNSVIINAFFKNISFFSVRVVTTIMIQPKWITVFTTKLGEHNRF